MSNATELLTGLIYNASLLLSLVILYQLVFIRLPRKKLSVQILTGLFFGVIVMIGIALSVQFKPGVIFDARSVILSLAGLFGGPVAGILAALMAATHRAMQGGAGVFVGILVALTATAMGIAGYYLRQAGKWQPNAWSIFLFSFIVHAVSLALMLLLPQDIRWQVFQQVSVPFLVVLPLTGFLAGILMLIVEDRYLAEERVSLSEQRFEDFVENLQYPLCQVSNAGELQYINRSFSQVFGYTLDDVPNLDEWWVLAYPDPAYREWVLATWSEAVAESGRTGSPIRSVEYRVTCKDGSTRYIEIAGITLHEGFLATFNDVSRQHQARAEADELLARLQKIASRVPGVVFQYQQWPDGRTAFPYASPGISVIYGVTPDAVKEDASAVFEALHPDDLERVTASIEQSMQTLTPWHDSHRAILPERGTIWLEGEAEPEAMPDGSVLWHGYIRDVTKRKQTEAQLHEQLGELNRWQQAMLGREQRIITVKQEVNALLAELGQPPRYHNPQNEGAEP